MDTHAKGTKTLGGQDVAFDKTTALQIDQE